MTRIRETDGARIPPAAEAPGASGAVLLAAGGLAAAFGAASCCALPMLLGTLGVGSAWLGGLALIARPHRLALLAAAVVCLIGAAVVLVRRRRVAAACTPGMACGRPMITVLMTGTLSLGAVFVVLGFLFA